MKTAKSYILLAAGLTMGMAACSDNAWNDKLPGFEVPPTDGTVPTADYVLTAANYKSIASNATNKALAEELGQEDVLAAIGADGCFQTDADAQRYIPALLADASVGLPYYAFNNGGSVKVGYTLVADQPEDVRAINNGTLQYTVTEEDYQMVWDSEEDFVNAFTPAHPASASVPQLLFNNVSANPGQYALVSYNQSSLEPDFGGEPVPGPTWSETSVIAKAAEGQHLEVHGIVTAIDARGFILTDKSGSILCYQASGFNQDTFPLGTQVIVKGDVTVFNKGLQIAIDGTNVTKFDTADYAYPAPVVVTGADMDAAIAATDPFLPKYVTLSGKLSVSGNYYNIAVEGAATAVGSLYMVPDYLKSQLEDGKDYRFYGYFMAISGTKYYNIVLTSFEDSDAKAAPRRAIRHIAPEALPTTVVNALYRFDGNKWAAASNVVVLSPADYTAMGLSNPNFNSTSLEKNAPVYLKQTFPYAYDGDRKVLVYQIYANSETSVQAREYVLEDSTWKWDAGEGVSQFTKKDNVWQFNPSVTITLPYSRNTEPSYTYYMACVNWVLDNVVRPENPDATLTTATPLIDYRGNAEFYSGASAFYGNVDIRASTAKNHCPDGYYDGLTDDQITALVKKRFCLETMRGALESLHADAKPVEGMDVLYTINFIAYTPAVEQETIVYRVSDPGKFEYVSCTWWENKEDQGWK